MNVLFLDDSRYRRRRFLSWCPSAVLVETAMDAMRALTERESWDWVFLDHDLRGETYCDPARPDTGSEVVRWIVVNRPVIGRVVIHSHNERAVPAMERMLAEAGYCVSWDPFGVSLPKWLEEVWRG